MHYSIKDVSQQMEISPHALRYYEKEGLLPDIHRTQGGIRYYTDEDLEFLGLICCLKKTGMALKDIKTFVQLSKMGPSTLKERCDILHMQQQNVIKQISELQNELDKVTGKLDYFSSLLNDYEKNDEGGK